MFPKKRDIILLVILFLLVIFLLSGTASGSTPGNITSCQTLDTSGLYTLIQNITDSTTSQCMDITANNITLDCQYNTISGNDSADYGIVINRTASNNTNITIKSCNLTNWDTAAVYLYYADNVTLENLSVSSNPDYGIYLSSSSENTIINSYANNNSNYGILLSSSSYNTITNSSANDNSGIGIYLYTDSDYNTITNSYANNNSENGILIYYSSNNRITNVTLLNNSWFDFRIYAGSDVHCDNVLENVTGTDNKPIVYYNESITIKDWGNNVSEIILCDADNSLIDNVTMNHTNKQNNAIYLSRTDNTNITNVNITNLRNGIHLQRSGNNTITNSYFYNNYRGIYLLYSSSSNTIYNNFFKNTFNFASGGFPSNNLNTTKIAGTNIIGGSYLGGNFWAFGNGSGYSETCPNNDNDGICDSPYQLLTNNIDYLPLTNQNANITTCIEILSSGTYYLGSDINDSTTSSCIDMDANNVVFDCQGYKIDGSDNSSSLYGIDISGYTNITIRNCTITNWYTAGIYIYNANNNSLENLNFSSNKGKDIDIKSSTNNTITNSYIGSVYFNNTGNVTSLEVKSLEVTANTPTELNFSSTTDSNMTLYLKENVNATVSVSVKTPSTRPTGLNTLKGIDIDTDSSTLGNLSWALITIFYNSSELTAANIQESTLKIYYYNETATSWQLEPNQSVNTTGNYVEANVTHFSIFGAFGSAPSTNGGNGGSGGGGGGAGGGGGGVTVVGPEDEVSQFFAALSPGFYANMYIRKPAIAFSRVSFNTNKNLRMVRVTIKKLVEENISVKIKDKAVYQYLRIKTENITDKDLANASIEFRVKKEWLTNNSINADDMALFRFKNGWNELSSEKTKGDETYLYYNAITAGFSYFAISLKGTNEEVPKEAEEIEKEEIVKEEEKQVIVEGEEEKYKDWIGWLIVVLVVMIGIGSYFVYLKKGKKKRVKK